jgi:hypothetical protein
MTRIIRLGLEAMWSAADQLPDDMQAPDDVRTALWTINDWLQQAETGKLRDRLTARNYAIIRPVSLLNPPGPQDMADIIAAISVLSTHGLVISEG